MKKQSPLSLEQILSKLIKADDTCTPLLLSYSKLCEICKYKCGVVIYHVTKNE